MHKLKWKLMDNINFGYDCRNNFNNSFVAPVIDELEEMSYICQHQNVLDPSVKYFVSTKLIEQQINEVFDNKSLQLDPFEDFYEVRKNSFELEKRKQLDSILSSINKKKKKPSKRQPKRS